MARVIALAYAPVRQFQNGLLRSAIVYGCAMALIAAGAFAPF